MTEKSEHDPFLKSKRESDAFNLAWMKHGERMTWTQRIGFAVFSFAFFSAGLLFTTYALADLRIGEIAGTAGWTVPAIIMGVPGWLGLRNVLRF